MEAGRPQVFFLAIARPRDRAIRSGRSSRRKLVDFDQSVPDAAVGPFHCRGVTSWRHRDENGGLAVVARREADVLKSGLLAVSPVVIRLDGCAISVVNFQQGIGEGSRNAEG